MIGIIDVGLGNTGSLLNMLAHLDVAAQCVSTPTGLAAADRLILPGVGAFDPGMTRLRDSGLLPALERRVRTEGVPLLGVCLGLQLLTRGSEEGSLPGLGWVPAITQRFKFADDAALRVPHMGWNECRPTATSSLFDLGGPELPRFYFVHSYHAVCDSPATVAAWTHYGGDFASAVQHGNIHAVQFHPEKSHRWGMKLLERFAALP